MKESAKKMGNFAKNATQFGVACAKVFSGVATPKDWKIFLKYAIPVALGGFFFSLMIFVMIISLLFGPAVTVINYVRSSSQNFTTWIADTAEKTGNFIRGNGWYDDETAFQEALKKKYTYYRNRGARVQTSYVMAVLNMKYVIVDNELDTGEDIDDADYDEMTEDKTEETEESDAMPFGKMIPDMKRLVKHMVNKTASVTQVSNENYLSYLRYGTWASKQGVTTHSKKMEYKEPDKEDIESHASEYSKGYIARAFSKTMEDMSEVDKAYKVESLIKEIYEYAETLEDLSDQDTSGLEVCAGNYQNSGTADIDLKDLSKVYVNVAGNCAQGSLEGCNNWIAQNVPFKEYIMGVVSKENNTTNLESLKAQFVASKSYTIGRIRTMGRKWHEVDGKYIIYMKGSTDDQVYGDINNLDEANRSRLSAAYDETVNDFIVDQDNNIAVASYCSDFGVCNFCKKGEGRCLAQQTANRTNNQTYKEILGYHYSSFNLYDMSNNTIQVSSVECISVAGGGSIRFPLDEGTYGISSPYGERIHPITKVKNFHDGIDLYSYGSVLLPIYAVAPGYVMEAQYNSGLGNYVKLGHDIDSDGNYEYTTTYGHASEILVKAGDTVSGGQQIAIMGSTGSSTGIHLHFKVTENGVVIDPTPILEQLKNGTSIFNQMIKAERRYYAQTDYPDAKYCSGTSAESDTIARSGCLPTSFAMVVSSLKDSSVTPKTVADTICNNSEFKKYKTDGGGTSSEILDLPAFLNKFGISGTHYTSDYETHIKESLKAGNVMIVNVKSGYFNPSNQGHYIALMEINSEGKVLVYDPASSINSSNTKSTYHDISTITSNIKNGIWAFK